MVRFPCPTCGKMLRAQEEKVGRSGVCPRCGDRVVTPGDTPPEDDGAGPQEAVEQPAGLLTSMGFGVRSTALALALVGVTGLLVAAVRPLVPEESLLGGPAASWAWVTSLCCLTLLGVVLHGHGTGCPSCNWWWTRERAGKEFLGREVFDKAGVPYGRSTYRTTYLCSSCKHTWSVNEAEEYRASAAGQGQPQRGR
jgi:DNA-directed RNA polymerase subunit RPC12/RpoP